MFGEPRLRNFQRTALFLGSITVLTMGMYATGMTAINVITNQKYSLTQSVTTRAIGSSAIAGGAYFDDESLCEEMARPFPGMTQDEKDYQQASQERCVKRVEEQRHQVRTLDFTHSALLLLIGSGLYLMSRKK